MAESNKKINRRLNTVKVAITGGAGSGKSTVCNRLRKYGLKIISADILARQAVIPGSFAYNKIVEYFGNKIVLPNRELNRQILRQIMVSDQTAHRALESFIHPEVVRLMEMEMQAAVKKGDAAVIFEIPLLFEAGLENMFDTIVVISIDRDLQIKRLMDRDTVSREAAKALLHIQTDNDYKIKHSEFIIENNSSPEDLTKAVDHFYKHFFEKYIKR